MVDEVEKQTLVTGHGLPVHRLVGDRFIDTPIAAVSDQDTVRFEMSYVLDVTHPVAMARSCLTPPLTFSLDSPDDSVTTRQAWLVHVSAKEVLVTDMKTTRRTDGKLAVRFKAIQTRPKSSNVRMQFCTFVNAAFVADQQGADRSLEELPDDVRCDDGVVVFSIASHQVLDLVAVFDA